MVSTQLGLGGRSRKLLRENLAAYLFLSPALLIIFVFGLFPVGFAFFVSLHRWRRFPEEFVGLAQYERALGDFAYVAFFWLALVAIGGAVVMAVRVLRQQRKEPKLLLLWLPGGTLATSILLVIAWFVTLLPIALDIPQRLRGQARSAGLFIGELAASVQSPEVVNFGNAALLMGLLSLLLIIISVRLLSATAVGTWLMKAAGALLLLCMGLAVLALTLTETLGAIEAALDAGVEAPIWTMTLMISAGVGMVVAAWFLWRRAMRSYDHRNWALMVAAAAALLGGGYALVGALPAALANADRAMLQAYKVTVMYTIGTVPIQIIAGLTLAYFLFQKIRFKSFFRVAYFLPYVTPFVATSIVFGILFSHRPTSPVNQLMTALGLPIQKWLLEPTGIFRLIFGPDVPDLLAGPSLALAVIILYSAWTYIGYATVLYLAGLGNISNELYEAARIDGASEWNVFRFMTLPLLSPTTFFLTLIAIIGTLQSFTQVWILRTPAAAQSVDTVGVVIYTTISATQPNMGYGAALSLVLFVAILLFTLLQNRISSGRVHYG